MRISLEQKHKRLLKGATIQLKPEHLQGKLGDLVELALSPKKLKTLERAKLRGKGCRLCLTDEEIEGAGLRDFFKKFAKGAKKVGKFYKEHLKKDLGPILKRGTKAALDAGLAAITVAQPELAPATAFLESEADAITDFIGDKTGAFGICPSCAGRGLLEGGSLLSKAQHGARTLFGGALPCPEDRFGSNAIYVNPAVAQPQYWPGFGMGPQYVHGGSFKAIGGSFSAV